MTSWMQNLFSLSAAGGLLALLLMALKPLYRDRITRAAQYYVWLLVLARLVLPVTLGLGVLGGLAPDGAAPQADGNLRWEGNLISDGISPDSPSGAAPEARPLDLSRQSLLPLLPWLWGAGAGVTLLVHGVDYGRFCHRVRRRCTPADAPTQALVLELWGPRRGAPEVFFSPLVPTPMLVGLLRPRVYLPEDGYAPGQLRDILLHELTHLRRHDLLVKWAALLVQAVHWFNPVLYLARRELNHACELACDEAVVRGMDREERIRYGQTLLSAAARARPPRGAVSATLCEEKARMRERLHALATRRERSLRTACLSALLVLVLLGTSVALGACAPQGTAPPAPTENPPQTASPPGNTTPAVSSEAQIRRWLGDHYAPGRLLSQAAEEEALAAFASYLQNTSWQADRYYGAQLTGRAEDGLPLLTLLSRDELGLSAGDSYYLDANGAVQVGPSGRVDTPEATLVLDYAGRGYLLIARGEPTTCPADMAGCPNSYWYITLYHRDAETGRETAVAGPVLGINPTQNQVYTYEGDDGEGHALVSELALFPHSDAAVLRRCRFDEEKLRLVQLRLETLGN